MIAGRGVRAGGDRARRTSSVTDRVQLVWRNFRHPWRLLERPDGHWWKDELFFFFLNSFTFIDFFSFFVCVSYTVLFFNFFKFYFIFKLYNIVLVLPYIEMNLPQAYMCSPSWFLLPPPSPYHPSGSFQCTSPKHPVSCIESGLATRFIYDIISSFSQIIPPSPSPTDKWCFQTSLLKITTHPTLCNQDPLLEKSK